MEMILYKTNDSDNVINKTLTAVYSFNLNMKKDVDIVQPIIILNDKGTMEFTKCNYCYLQEFDRYYFIRAIDNVSNHLWSLSLECDVLESFKLDILISVVEINKPIGDGEFYVNDIKSEVRKEVDLYEGDTEFTKDKTIILSSIGGV